MIILVLAARPTGDEQGGKFLKLAQGDDDNTLLDLVEISKKARRVVNQSRLQRYSNDIFGLPNNQLKLVRHCHSSTILSHKY